MAETYTLGTIIDEIIDDSKDSGTSRTRVARYVRRTQDKVLGHQRFSFNEDTVTDTLTAGTSTYDPDCSFQQIIQLTFAHSTLTEVSKPVYLPADDYFESFPLGSVDPQAGAPAYYTYYGSTIYWSRPIPADYDIGIRYQSAPCRLDEETDCPDIPEEFSGILYEGGMAGVERYRENHDIAGVHDRMVEEMSEDLLGRYGLRKRQPGRVKSLARRRVGRGA